VIAPIVVAMSGLLVLVDASGRGWLRYLVAIHGAVLIAVCLRMPISRSGADPWDAEVTVATHACRTQPTLTAVRLPISPGPPWTIVVPCSRLR
jgi:hypothetical protein